MTTQKQLNEAAALMGHKGGSANTAAQNAARAKNAKHAGAPKLCQCGHKRKQHYMATDGKVSAFCECHECNCVKYRAQA